MRRPGARHPPRRAGPPGDSAQRARHSGAADGGRLRLPKISAKTSCSTSCARAWPYRTLPRADFDAVLEMLSEGIATARGRSGAYLHRDAVNRRRARPARRAPHRHHLRRRHSGHRAVPGGGRARRHHRRHGGRGFRRGEHGRRCLPAGHHVLAHPARRSRARARGRRARRGARHSVLARRSARPHRSSSRARCPSCARRSPRRRRRPRECGLDRAAPNRPSHTSRPGAPRWAPCPPTDRVVAERFFDEAGGMQLVIHAPFGARINRAWGLALRKRFCRSFNFELQAAATDNGIVISLGEQHSFPLEIVFEFLRPETVRGGADAGAAGRAHVHRALALERLARARHPALQRRPQGAAAHPAHARRRPDGRRLPRPGRLPRKPHRRSPHSRPSAGERDHRQLPVRGHGPGRPASDARSHSATARIRTVAIDTPEPSPFSHEILNANPYAYLDDAPLEERRARAVQMRRTLPADYAEGAGRAGPRSHRAGGRGGLAARCAMPTNCTKPSAA